MRFMVLKYKQASLYPVVMVPHVCCIQSIKFLTLSAVSAFAAKVLQNKSLKSQSFSEKKKSIIYSHNSHLFSKVYRAAGAWLDSLAAHGWAGQGWAGLI